MNTNIRNALLVISTLLPLTLAGGYYSFMHLSGDARRHINTRLNLIADLKLSELSGWLEARKREVLFHAQHTKLRLMVSRMAGKKNTNALAELAAHLRDLSQTCAYDSALLLDVNGQIIASIGGLLPPADFRQTLLETLKHAQDSAVMTSLNPSPAGQEASLVLAALVLSESGQTAAILLVSLHPAPYLNTFTHGWPSAYPPGYISMAQQDNNRLTRFVGYDFDLPVCAESPLIENHPSGWHEQQGLSCSLRHIPDTSWYMIVSADDTEIRQINRQLARMITLLILLSAASPVILLLLIRGKPSRRGTSGSLKPNCDLHHTSTYFRDTFEQVAVGIAHTDIDERILHINQKLCDLLGQEAVSLLGHTFQSLYLSERRTKKMDYVEKLLDGRIKRFELERPYLRQHKQIIWFHITISLYSNDSGSPVYLIWVFEDITQRHQAEKSLMDSEALYKALFEHSPVALIENDFSRAIHQVEEWSQQGIQDITGYLLSNPESLRTLATLIKITNLNQEASRLLALNPDQPMPESLSEYYNAESFVVFVRQFDKLRSADSIFKEEMPLITADGKSIWIAVHTSVLPGHNNDYKKVLLSLIDITERKKMESRLLSINAELESRVYARTAELMSKTTELQDAYAEQQALFESVSSGICLLKDMVITRCNSRLGEIYGYEPEEMLNKPISEFYPDAGSYLSSVAYYEYIRDGMTVRLDLPQIRKDGSGLFCRISGRLLDAGNPEKGSVWVMEDITQEHRMTEDLVIAKNAAEVANSSKSNFLTNMGHEIRTPLNAILGYTHLLCKDVTDWRQKDHLQRISDAAQHLLDIISDILDISKIEAGKLTLEISEFRLDDTIGKVYSLVMEKAYTNGLEIVSDIDPTISTVLLGDSLRLGQVLLNLVSNAVKFTQKGYIRVVAHCLHEAADGTVLVRFEVQDTGMGIDAEAQSRLFQPFEQADDSITRQFGGTGLGLAISQRLVQMMGGDIGCNSTPGAGSTFWFTLPVKRGEFGQPHLARESPTPLKILVLEDQVVVREVLIKMLNHLGFEADTVDSETAALDSMLTASASHTGYDAVMVDAKIAGPTGGEWFTKLNQLQLTKTPKYVFMLTPLADYAWLDTWSQKANILFLSKPVTLTSLSECLSSVLDHELANFTDEDTHAAQVDARLNSVTASCPAQENPSGSGGFVRELQGLLEDNNIQATRIFHEHEKAMAEMLGDKAVEFACLMKKFDFDHALEILHSATRTQVNETGKEGNTDSGDHLV